MRVVMEMVLPVLLAENELIVLVSACIDCSGGGLEAREVTQNHPAELVMIVVQGSGRHTLSFPLGSDGAHPAHPVCTLSTSTGGCIC